MMTEAAQRQQRPGPPRSARTELLRHVTHTAQLSIHQRVSLVEPRSPMGGGGCCCCCCLQHSSLKGGGDKRRDTHDMQTSPGCVCSADGSPQCERFTRVLHGLGGEGRPIVGDLTRTGPEPNTLLCLRRISAKFAAGGVKRLEKKDETCPEVINGYNSRRGVVGRNRAGGGGSTRGIVL